MTRKLYYEDSFCREFEAKVISCTEVKSADNCEFEVVLDRSAFYPEGGGQSGDKGILYTCASGAGVLEGGACSSKAEDAVHVLDTREREGEIIHLCDKPLEEGAAVRGAIDWDFRFDLMQNHTGEHIVSGLIHESFGYDNVGFHMGSDIITIDLNGMLTYEQLHDIELRANEIVWQDVPVIVETYSDEAEAADLDYRSKKELDGEVRIVRIPGADVCACCGTHVKRTGQIGPIMLLSCQKFRKGVRIEMLCGRRAYLYDAGIREQNHRVSVLLSAKSAETGAAVLRMKEQMQEVSGRLYEYRLREIDRIARQHEKSGNTVLFGNGLLPDQLCRLAVAVMEACGGICCAFSGDDENGYRYAIGKAGDDIREFIKTLNSRCGGKGGGKPNFAQGSLGSSRDDILKTLYELEEKWSVSEAEL